MRRISGKRTLALLLASLSTALCLQSPTAGASRASLGTITGAVLDNRGNPLAGAFISVLRDGGNRIIKEARTDAAGRFSTRIAPGRYVIRAIAEGFNSVVFSSVEVRSAQELVYRFNLEPIGSGKTLPEKRRDREDVKWTLRSSQTRRSIFQAQEGDDRDIQAVLGIEPGADTSELGSTTDSEKEPQRRMRGVVETYFAGNAYSPGYSGLNFAVATSGTGVDLILAGQTGVGPNAPQRLEASTHFRAAERHRIGLNLGAVSYGSPVWRTVRDNSLAQPVMRRGLPAPGSQVGQFAVRAIDEWIIHDGIVVVLGLDYSRFIGAGGAHAINPRVGVQFDANARTRLRVAYAPGGDESQIQSVAPFEGTQVAFTEANKRPIAFVDGRAVMERSHRLEFGVERVIDNESNLEASAFFDTTTGRGVGLLSTPITAFSGATGEAFINVANQQGESRGMRLVYTRRLSRVWTASAGYSFGRGQRLSTDDISRPTEMFESGFFQTAALQFDGGFGTGTNVQTVLRFSPNATVFAIDPFAGRLAVYDPSLSIQVTQELPSFGLPLRAEAVLDARNLLDLQANTENAETLTQLNAGRRSVRGGISLRF